MTATPDGPRTACWDLPPSPAVVGRARDLVREVLTTWGAAHLRHDVVLVMDELLVNAITHGEPPIRLSVWLASAVLCVRVTDHGDAMPRRLRLSPDALHGRGLELIDALATAHGVTPLRDGPGKTVWARWDLS
ncbi:ATP-binding protein [Sphaerisporangium krabiense]|uniref:Anti-sigma regulatory factor (Ser/Thr protein kinase) n=1 Tax=Sphaerisporangium krabiense TaxID=763782 RepID=A0A7W8Z1K8_9ACTN|nr:ATP-binding protein [Sphaerisporangium krabiense]MBB5625754.1 anti-sigma regulatory factor (Ser/Thr protein kinase) [Sphaerisporangium krabiense]